MYLNFVEKHTQKCDRENQEWWWCQIKSIYRLHLDLVVRQLCYISCLNASATNCATSRNQNLCCGTVFLHKNDETKNSSGLQFKAQHKKACFLFRANWTCLSWAGGSPPLPPLVTHLISDRVRAALCMQFWRLNALPFFCTVCHPHKI